MDLRETWIDSPSGFFQPLVSKDTGEFLHRIRFEFEGYTCECPSRIISDFLLAKYEFRVALQLRDGEKEDPNNEGIRDGTNTEYVRCERNLYFKDAALPYLTLEKMHRFAFDDLRWYMRDTLTGACKLSSGCCGQACGCCEKRKHPWPRKDINGHCTWACRCCIERKGFSFKDYDGNGFEKQYKDAFESDNPVFLLRMADGYFLKPSSRPPLNPESSSESGNHAQSTIDQQDASANDDASQDSAINIISDPCPPPYSKEVAKDNGERKEKRLWPWKIF